MCHRSMFVVVSLLICNSIALGETFTVTIKAVDADAGR